jgi:hypothetical protein
MDFRNIKVSFTIALLLMSNGALAAEKKDLQKQTVDFKVDSKKNISQEAMIEAARGQIQERSDIRNMDDIQSLRRGASESELDLMKVQLEIKKSKFISKNVPIAYIIAGDKEVENYVRSQYIDNDNAAPGAEIKTVWKSNKGALTEPDSAKPLWKPVLSHKNMRSPDIEVRDLQVSNTTVSKVNKQSAADAQKEALESLGITPEDLAELTGKKTPVVDVTPVIPVGVTETNVVINQMDVDRLILMGKKRSADVTVEFNVIRGEQSRKVQKSFKGVSEGYVFSIDDIQFELVALNKKILAFTNLETKQAFRTLID